MNWFQVFYIKLRNLSVFIQKVTFFFQEARPLITILYVEQNMAIVNQKIFLGDNLYIKS